MTKSLLLTSALVVAAMWTPLEVLAESHTTITMEQFLKLPADGRLEVCLKHVPLTDLGACMNLKHRDKPATHASAEKIELEMMRCAKGTGSGLETELAACARDRLNKGVLESHQFIEAQFQTAARVCSKRVGASTDIGSCMAAVLSQIGKSGNYH